MKKIMLIGLLLILLVGCQNEVKTKENETETQQSNESKEEYSIETIKEWLSEKDIKNLTQEDFNFLEAGPVTTGRNIVPYQFSDGTLNVELEDTSVIELFIRDNSGNIETLYKKEPKQFMNVASLKEFVSQKETHEIYQSDFDHLVGKDVGQDVVERLYNLEDGQALVSSPSEEEEVYSISVLYLDGSEESLFNHNLPDESDQRG